MLKTKPSGPCPRRRPGSSNHLKACVVLKLQPSQQDKPQCPRWTPAFAGDTVERAVGKTTPYSLLPIPGTKRLQPHGLPGQTLVYRLTQVRTRPGGPMTGKIVT